MQIFKYFKRNCKFRLSEENYGYLVAQIGGSESGYTTSTFGFGYGASKFPDKTGGGYYGNTYLIGKPIPFSPPLCPFDFGEYYWYYRLRWFKK